MPAGRPPARADGPSVLVLDEELPYPLDTGKKIRTFHLLSRLAREFPIEMLVHASGAAPARRAALEEVGIRVHVAPSRVPDKRGVAFAARLAGNALLSRLPYSVASHRRPEFASALTRLLGERRHDLLHCEWTPYHIYAEGRGVPTLVAAHNVEGQIWERMAEMQDSPARRAFFAMQARRMQRFERAVFSRVGAATAVSEEDARTIGALGCRRVTVVPNGVDTSSHSFAEPAGAATGTLVFTGSMDWRPNQDAVEWFAEEIEPRLRRLAEHRLVVVGRNPPRWLAERAARAGTIELTGTVDDVRPYLRRADVCIVPLRIGGGSRLKILEAMSTGRPVVSTTVGAEGLRLQEGREILVADEPQQFAEAVASLLADGARRREMARAGRSRVEREYDWSVIASRQAEAWRAALGAAAVAG